MTDRLLAGIIDLEKALHQEVHRETERADAWQARELEELAAGLARLRRDLAQSLDDQLAAARRQAAAERAALQRAAAARQSRLAALPEELLRGLLRRELTGLLPEDDHDHPHGEG